MKGRVKIFNPGPGWGFIRGEDGQDYFVHHSELTDAFKSADGRKYLAQGQKVTFRPVEAEKGLAAKEVK